MFLKFYSVPIPVARNGGLGKIVKIGVDILYLIGFFESTISQILRSFLLNEVNFEKNLNV
jgi:hypothetical protein